MTDWKHAIIGCDSIRKSSGNELTIIVNQVTVGEVIIVASISSQLIPKLIFLIVQGEPSEVRTSVCIPAGRCRVEGGVKVVLWESSLDRFDPAQLLTWTFGVYCVLNIGTGFTEWEFRQDGVRVTRVIVSVFIRMD